MQRPSAGSFTLEDAQAVAKNLTQRVSQLEQQGHTNSSHYDEEIENLANIFNQMSREAFLSLDNLTSASETSGKIASHTAYANVFNNVSLMITANIQNANSPQTQKQIYERWARVLDQCYEKGDLYSCHAISSALEAGVNREVKKAASPQIIKKLDKFLSLQIGVFPNGLDEFNKVVRKNAEAIPYFGVFQSKLVSLKETVGANDFKFLALINELKIADRIPVQFTSVMSNNEVLLAMNSDYMNLMQDIRAYQNQGKKIPEKLQAQKSNLEDKIGNYIEKLLNAVASDAKIREFMAEKILNANAKNPAINKLLDGNMTDRLAEINQDKKLLDKTAAIQLSPDQKKLLIFVFSQNAQQARLQRITLGLKTQQNHLSALQERRKNKNRVGFDLSDLKREQSGDDVMQKLEAKREERKLAGLGSQIEALRDNLKQMLAKETSAEAHKLINAMLKNVGVLKENQALSDNEQKSAFAAAFRKLSDQRFELYKELKEHASDNERPTQKASNSTSLLSNLFSKKEKDKEEVSPTKAIEDDLKNMGFAQVYAENSMADVKPSPPTPTEHASLSPSPSPDKSTLDVAEVKFEAQGRADHDLTNSQQKLMAEGYDKPLPEVPKYEKELPLTPQPKHSKEDKHFNNKGQLTRSTSTRLTRSERDKIIGQLKEEKAAEKSQPEVNVRPMKLGK